MSTPDSAPGPQSDPQSRPDTDPANAPDTIDDPAHDTDDQGWSSEGGATSEGPATDT